jgi:hypothetical protein
VRTNVRVMCRIIDLFEEPMAVPRVAGQTYSGWLFIRYLWVSDALRGRGLGGSSWATQRPVRSSAVAIRPGSTPSASRLRASIPGYEVFGELDYPPGHKRIFLQKRLAEGVRAQVYARE